MRQVLTESNRSARRRMPSQAHCRGCWSQWSAIPSSRRPATSASCRKSCRPPRTGSRSRGSSITTPRRSTTPSSSSSPRRSSRAWHTRSGRTSGRSKIKPNGRYRRLTSPDANLFQQQEANRRRTTWLVIGFVLFFAWLGFGGDYVWALQGHHPFPWVGILLTTVAIITAWHTYKTGPEKVLWATGAQELIDQKTDAERQVANVVDEMAIAAGIPRPRLWIIPDDDPNALATGHDPRDSHIAVTRGLLKICNRDELQAVIAHELGHVKNLDVRLMTTLAALVGAVLLVRDGMGRTMRGGGIPLRGGRKGKSAGPLLAILLALWVISWIIAPLVTQLLALAVSRRREYLADAMSAQFTRNPLALASALEKIEGAAAPTTSIKSGAAHLCICDPLGRRLTNSEGWLADRFATHPPMSMRISRLKGMGYAQLKKEGGSSAISAPA